MRFLVISAALLLCAGAAQAQTAPQPLMLKASVTDGDGRITLGDVFDNAGAASDVLLGYRQGATAVLDAAIVQSIAARNGVRWDNPRGLRRIIVAAGPETASGEQPQLATITTPQTYAGWGGRAPAMTSTGPVVVKRSQAVDVTWSRNGLSLTMTGVAQKDGGIGDVVPVQNTATKKVIDVVVTGPGAAVVGPAATQMSNPTYVSSR